LLAAGAKEPVGDLLPFPYLVTKSIEESDRNFQLTKLLVERGFEDEHGFLTALESGSKKTALLIAERMRDPNERDYDGMMPIVYAARSGYVEVIKALLKRGADVDLRCRPVLHTGSDKPMHLTNAYLAAAAAGHLEVMKYLGSIGANTRARSELGETPLMLAAAHSHEAAVRYLIDQGEDVRATDKAGDETIFYAAKGSPEILQKLLQAGADFRSINNQGLSLLQVAAMEGRPETVRFLLGLGLDPNVTDGHGRTPLHHAVGFKGESGVQAVQALVAHGARTNVQDRGGRTPLMIAARSGGSESVRILLRAGADVNLKDRLGRTALLMAAEGWRARSIELLLKARANARDRDAQGVSAVEMAVKRDLGDVSLFGEDEMVRDAVKALHRAGADITVRDQVGQSLVFWANQRFRYKTAKYLEAAGVR
jgi:ankyrin repeat protein